MNLFIFYFYKFIGKLTVFLTVSGVQFEEHDRGHFHFLRVSFSSQIKSKVGNILTKTETIRIVLNIDGTPVVSVLTLVPWGWSFW